ncbi:hypothetical protein [Streptomyces guryensis]|uniref:Uncharacterized protein n=1 Tax=Streptomyces guryensis TaxID=2886947 RepID=A0A9Q3VW95_9ACTN|nr:hypothetical protein [Streptomyces guryensis]MCD9879586.1 hypothetical protein [Streptomyces guryensis]
MVTATTWAAKWPLSARKTPVCTPSSGTLTAHEPSDGAPSTYVYDPARPTPALGGPLLTLDGGGKDNADLESRSDVRTLYEEAIRQLALENDALRSGGTVLPVPNRSTPAPRAPS